LIRGGPKWKNLVTVVSDIFGVDVTEMTSYHFKSPKSEVKGRWGQKANLNLFIISS